LCLNNCERLVDCAVYLSDSKSSKLAVLLIKVCDGAQEIGETRRQLLTPALPVGGPLEESFIPFTWLCPQGSTCLLCQSQSSPPVLGLAKAFAKQSVNSVEALHIDRPGLGVGTTSTCGDAVSGGNNTQNRILPAAALRWYVMSGLISWERCSDSE
jgi:hypothetical protein